MVGQGTTSSPLTITPGLFARLDQGNEFAQVQLFDTHIRVFGNIDAENNNGTVNAFFKQASQSNNDVLYAVHQGYGTAIHGLNSLHGYAGLFEQQIPKLGHRPSSRAQTVTVLQFMRLPAVARPQCLRGMSTSMVTCKSQAPELVSFSRPPTARIVFE